MDEPLRTMLGSRDGVLQILSRDGQFRTVDPSLPLQSSFSGFLTDDDQVFLHLGAGQDSAHLQPGAVVIGSAGAVNIGRGLMAAPPGTQLLGEMAVLFRVSSTGHAIGTVRYDLEFDDRCLGVPDVSSGVPLVRRLWAPRHCRTEAGQSSCTTSTATAS